MVANNERSADVTGLAVELSSGGSICQYSLDRPEHPSVDDFVTVELSHEADYSLAETRPIEVTQNSAFEDVLGTECYVLISLREWRPSDKKLPVLAVKGDLLEGDDCAMAREVAPVVFDMLPDA